MSEATESATPEVKEKKDFLPYLLGLLVISGSLASALYTYNHWPRYQTPGTDIYNGPGATISQTTDGEAVLITTPSESFLGDIPDACQAWGPTKNDTVALGDCQIKFGVLDGGHLATPNEGAQVRLLKNVDGTYQMGTTPVTMDQLVQFLEIAGIKDRLTIEEAKDLAIKLGLGAIGLAAIASSIRVASKIKEIKGRGLSPARNRKLLDKEMAPPPHAKRGVKQVPNDLESLTRMGEHFNIDPSWVSLLSSYGDADLKNQSIKYSREMRPGVRARLQAEIAKELVQMADELEITMPVPPLSTIIPHPPSSDRLSITRLDAKTAQKIKNGEYKNLL